MSPLAVYGHRIDEILRAPMAQRPQALFDAYRVLNAHDREDFVICLIGRLLIAQSRAAGVLPVDPPQRARAASTAPISPVKE